MSEKKEIFLFQATTHNIKYGSIQNIQPLDLLWCKPFQTYTSVYSYLAEKMCLIKHDVLGMFLIYVKHFEKANNTLFLSSPDNPLGKDQVILNEQFEVFLVNEIVRIAN